MNRDRFAESCPTLSPLVFAALDGAAQARAAAGPFTDDSVRCGVKLMLAADLVGYYAVRWGHARYYAGQDPMAPTTLFNTWIFFRGFVGIIQLLWALPLIAAWALAGKKQAARGMTWASLASVVLTPVYFVLGLAFMRFFFVG